MKLKQNPQQEFKKNPIFSDTYLCDNGLKVFKNKNILPLNHSRRVNCVKDSNGNICKYEKTIPVYKDNLALNCECRTKPHPPNPNFISSYKTYIERRNRSYENNFKFNNMRQKNFNRTIIKHNNPKFIQTGAVTSRNRIAALKNGNLNNNIYKKRCDKREVWYKKKQKITKNNCKPYHYGGKWKYALLNCPPKN